MQKRIEILNGLELGEFVQINETDYKSDNADAIVLTHDELKTLVLERIKEEIPYVKNERLKKYLPEKYQSDVILDDYKELAKFDHTILSNLIIDIDLFAHDMISPPDELDVADLVLSNSAWAYGDDQYIIFVTEIEETT